MFCEKRTYLGAKGQTDKQKELMGERSKIVKELNKIYLEMLNATFPVDDDVVIPSKKVPSTPCTPEVPSTPSTPLDPSTPITPTVEQLAMPNQYDPTKVRDDGYDPSKFSTSFDGYDPSKSFPKMMDMTLALDDITDKKVRVKADNKSASDSKVPLDVPEEVTLALGDNLKKMIKSSLRVLVPSGGALATVLRDRGVNVVTDHSQAQAIVTFPSFDSKSRYLPQYKALGLPLFVLLPLEDASSKEWRKFFAGCPFDLVIINGSCLFLQGDRIRNGGSHAWFMFYPNATGKMSLVNVGGDGDVVLGDEDSEGGRDYDSDEKDCEDLDNAVLNDPNSKFTKEGFLVDGCTVPDDEIEDEDYAEEEEEEEDSL